jgi:rhodanese-related sulfurtransferase
MSTWKQAALIGLLAVAAAFTVNTLRAGGLPVKHAPQQVQKAGGADTLSAASAKLAEIGFAEADALFRKELATFVDAREAADYAKGHIPGALNITPDGYKSGKEKLPVPKGSLVVVYCDGGDCELSHDLAALLAKAGFKKLRIYAGGWSEWDALGQPVEK